jgi:hypothetical protein
MPAVVARGRNILEFALAVRIDRAEARAAVRRSANLGSGELTRAFPSGRLPSADNSRAYARSP